MAKIVCENCGRTASGLRAAQNDGWLINEDNDGKNYCCCMCRAEYNKKKTTKKKK